MNTVPHIGALTSRGITLLEGSEPFNEQALKIDETIKIRNIYFSFKGNYLAYKSEKKTELLRCSDWSTVASFSAPIKGVIFSPLDTYFVTYEHMFYSENNPGKPNLHVYKTATGELVASYGQKNSMDWEIQWSGDEKLFAWQEGSRVLVYQDEQMDRYVNYIQTDKIKNFSLSPSVSPAFFFAVFVPGKSGKPSVWKVFKHPEYTTPVVSRSSFQADKCKFHWNRRGTNVLVLTQTELDKTGGSYYGKQTLSYGDVKGTAGNVPLGKEGPVHAVSWSPGNWNEWVCVYGHTPAKATLFNAKCEPIFEFGSNSWNSIYYSRDGSRLSLAGFGNISSGMVEVWDPRTQKKLGSFTAMDTTFLQWDPRSECIITASTYPRLTVSNGYKIWHYTGVLMHKRALEDGHHLLSISWQPGTFPKSELSTSAPKGIEDGAPKASTQAYRPPGARGRPNTFTLHVTEAAHKPGEAPSSGPSKAALKQKEKREKAKARKAEERAAVGEGEGGGPASPPPPAAAKPAFQSTGDPELDKKIKNLQKKINDIAKLKEARAAGKTLELNQRAKIDSEPALLKELAQLKL